MGREVRKRNGVRLAIRPFLLLGALLAFVVLAALSSPRSAQPASAPSSASAALRATCGVERWTVKTLQDRPRLLPVKQTTIAFLVNQPAPHPLPSTRLPFERHVYRVTAAVTLDRPEDDGDYHLVLSDGTRTMIAESPSTACVAGATPLRRRQMAKARGAGVPLSPRYRHRSRLLRLQARADGSRTERD